jgi:hypothetical protein
MRIFMTSALLCSVAIFSLTNFGLAYDAKQPRCSFVRCVDHCIKTGEAPKGTYRGGGGCGKLCQQKGCK